MVTVTHAVTLVTRFSSRFGWFYIPFSHLPRLVHTAHTVYVHYGSFTHSSRSTLLSFFFLGSVYTPVYTRTRFATHHTTTVVHYFWFCCHILRSIHTRLHTSPRFTTAFYTPHGWDTPVHVLRFSRSGSVRSAHTWFHTVCVRSGPTRSTPATLISLHTVGFILPHTILPDLRSVCWFTVHTFTHTGSGSPTARLPFRLHCHTHAFYTFGCTHTTHRFTGLRSRFAPHVLLHLRSHSPHYLHTPADFTHTWVHTTPLVLTPGLRSRSWSGIHCTPTRSHFLHTSGSRFWTTVHGCHTVTHHWLHGFTRSHARHTRSYTGCSWTHLDSRTHGSTTATFATPHTTTHRINRFLHTRTHYRTAQSGPRLHVQDCTPYATWVHTCFLHCTPHTALHHTAHGYVPAQVLGLFHCSSYPKPAHGLHCTPPHHAHHLHTVVHSWVPILLHLDLLVYHTPVHCPGFVYTFYHTTDHAHTPRGFCLLPHLRLHMGSGSFVHYTTRSPAHRFTPFSLILGYHWIGSFTRFYTTVATTTPFLQFTGTYSTFRLVALDHLILPFPVWVHTARFYTYLHTFLRLDCLHLVYLFSHVLH